MGDVERKQKGGFFFPRMERGMKDMPKTVSVYTELGLRIRRAAAAAAAVIHA